MTIITPSLLILSCDQRTMLTPQRLQVGLKEVLFWSCILRTIVGQSLTLEQQANTNRTLHIGYVS